ncbi:hypothetical protein N7492_004951 [Penicillium capsulatum]|uniref:Tubby C-terminal domain-containing protein n=1 Tax=Penicillium capsulatum TaxID=69766 RepID=A0A9W9LRN6_9EURO|nr:hypothetical protein N7492_004951 [Penicillium capsulatum]KAJ6135942.1 hypothetical protein N7512_001102 [Penicillium capsulatum]
MPSQPLLSPPHQPVAIHRSHLLAPAPDRLTNTPTILSITRENTLSGRDFTVHHFRSHEPASSPRHSSLLYTVAGRYWSNSQHREIRNAAGHPLLELKRNWWRKSWTVKRAGSSGDGAELLTATFKWGMFARITVRFENALVGGAWDEFRRRASGSVAVPLDLDEPPPYSAVVAEHNRVTQAQAQALEGAGVGTGTGTGTGASQMSLDQSDCASVAGTECTLPPTYESVRRNSHHSLRDLLDAIEPPREPAPAAVQSQRPRSEGSGPAKVELKVEEQGGLITHVMMGTRKIIHIKRQNFMLYSVSGGPLPKWEVKVAEGVDLLLATSIVLMLAEFTRHEYRFKSS